MPASAVDNVIAHMRNAVGQSSTQVLGIGSPRLQVRKRFTIAQVNAGDTIIPAPGVGYKLRMLDAIMIAVGGNAAGATTVDILGKIATVASKLVAGSIATMTQSLINRAGNTNIFVLADGGSFVPLDANTPITIGKTGASLTTATHIDVILDYAIDKI